jgi:hypothetical protein
MKNPIVFHIANATHHRNHPPVWPTVLRWGEHIFAAIALFVAFACIFGGGK